MYVRVHLMSGVPKMGPECTDEYSPRKLRPFLRIETETQKLWPLSGVHGPAAFSSPSSGMNTQRRVMIISCILGWSSSQKFGEPSRRNTLAGDEHSRPGLCPGLLTWRFLNFALSRVAPPSEVRWLCYRSRCPKSLTSHWFDGNSTR